MPAKHDALSDQGIHSQGHGLAFSNPQEALGSCNLATKDLQPCWLSQGKSGSIHGGCKWLGVPRHWCPQL